MSRGNRVLACHELGGGSTRPPDVSHEAPRRAEECDADVAGHLEVEGADLVLRGIAIDIRIVSSSPADQVSAMQEAWLQRRPV